MFVSQGGYRTLKTLVVRSNGSRAQVDAVRCASMPKVYEALNFLGKVKWVINKEVYDIVQVRQGWFLVMGMFTII
jgi:DNA-directed RNA polymerase